MEVVFPICCGLDVHKKVIVATLRRVGAGGAVAKETRDFGTTHGQLIELGDWLNERSCPVVAMESSGVYWKPVYHVLSGMVDEIVVGNARDIRPKPGKKTDKKDSDWISELLAHGLISPSFIPPPPIMALRDVARARVGLVQTRSQAKNRVHKILEDTNIKVASVVSDLFGRSGRAMLDALVAGGRDPKVLAQMAQGKLRRKIPQLELALVGQFTEHHARLIKQCLVLIDLLNAQITELDDNIAELVAPLETELEQLTSIPGVSSTAGQAILSEIGVDMSRFGSDSRLASWAGVCPGNNESAGKRRSGKTRKGNRYIRRVLAQCAWAARKTDSFLGHTFRRLEARIGGKKAAVAVGHKILVITYHLLSEGTFYDEQNYEHHNERRNRRLQHSAVKTLERLGFTVDLAQQPT